MIHDWTRYWTTPDGRISLADQGFLVGPSTDVLLGPLSEDLWTFEQIADRRCLILLGEPGIGKSETLEREATRTAAVSRDSSDLLLRVDLGATREESVLREEIFQSDEFVAWAHGNQELHLFLDSLDEAVVRLGVVADIILKGLRDSDVARLRIRLACRTSDRLLDFESRLTALWPEGESGVYELAPLRRTDVRLAASDRGQDPDDFVQGLVERDIVPLAIKPVTLAMLLDLAADPRGLPGSQLELYERGLWKLVSEPAERRRRDRAVRGELTTGQRLAVAGRVAASTIMTGRPTIASGEIAAGTTALVSLVQLSGGRERDLTGPVPTAFDVTTDGVSEVLGTGLFSARGADLGWAHQTYGEFLAARYLAQSEIPLGQVCALLIPEPDDGRVVPQLRDVAGSLAAMDDRFMEELVARDPLVLLRGEIGLASEDLKARLATALLHERAARELNKWDPRTRRNLRELGYAGIDETLRTHITDAGRPIEVRQLACSLAALCQVPDVQEDLLRVALDAAEAVPLRAEAVKALATVADASTRRKLIPLARDPLPEDTDDELKGATLRAVCPAVASASDVLGFLTPQKERNLTGAYAAFLYRDLPAALTDDELASALEWVRRLPRSHDPMDEFGRLSEEILVRGVTAMDREDVLAALLETVIDYLREHDDLQTWRTRDRSDGFRADDNRHRLVHALVPFVREGSLDPMWLVMSTPRLLTGADLPWLSDQLIAAIDGEDEPVWADLVAWGLRFENADHDLVMRIRERSPVLFEKTRPQFGPVELDSALAGILRERYRQEEKRAAAETLTAEDAPDFDSDLDLLLDRFESGELDAYWQLNMHIWGELGSRHLELGGSDLTSSPGWRRATARRRARIAAAAIPYLREYEPSQEWVDPQRRYHPASAGYRALRYLAEHDPEGFEFVGMDRVCRWIPAVLTFTHNAGDDDEQTFSVWLLRRIAAACPEALADASCRLVTAEARHGEGNLFALYRLQPIIADRVGEALLDLWRRGEFGAQPEAELLRALLRAQVPGATAAGLALVTQELIASDRDRARRLTSELLAAGQGVWRDLWPLITEHPSWGADVFETLAHDWDRAADFRTELSEHELGDLVIWLSERFPPHEDPSRLGTHFVGPREQVAEYRDHTLGLIIDKGTKRALDELDRVQETTGRDLSYTRIRAEEAWRLKRWIPPRPEDIVQLAADAQRRVVLSEPDLQRVLLEALDRIQEMLDSGGQAHQVWDTAAGRPKRETELAAWIADRLRDDLRGRGIIINREVEVRVNPRGGMGERTDIHVDALAGEKVEGAQQITVVIEVKGCWHRELMTAMRSQLADEYLSSSQRYGLYLVVWFDAAGWRDSDDRRAACGRLDRHSVLAELNAQAGDLRRDGFFIAPVFVDASLRSRGDEN